jgi:hypothetical protein
MAIKRPDIYEHQNPNEPIADTDFVKGGFRTKVADLTALYALAPKVNQMKEHATSVWVISKAKYYTLVDASNVGNSGGWSDSVLGSSAEIQTEDFTADFDKVYNCRGTFEITNPTGVLNKSYEVRVLGGAVTVGGEVFQTGSNVHISYNGTTFDYNLRIDIKAVPLTQVTGAITIDSSHSYRTVELIVGTTPTTVTISEETKECYFIKNGTATVTFVSDAGRTLIQMNSVNTINTNGSVALVISSGTTDRLFVNDNTNLNFLPLANIKTPVAPVASFSGNPTTATVTFLGPFPSGSNYNVQPEFSSFESGWKVTSKTDAGFTFSINQATAPTADVNFLVIKI